MSTPPMPSNSGQSRGVSENVSRKGKDFLGELFRKHVKEEKKVQTKSVTQTISNVVQKKKQAMSGNDSQ